VSFRAFSLISLQAGTLPVARASLILALDSGFYALDDIKKDPEIAYLYATLAAPRFEPGEGQRNGT
jgi:hypothetical protein